MFITADFLITLTLLIGAQLILGFVVVEGTATEVETNGVVANGEKGAAEEEGLAGSEGYDTAGRALIPWTEITDARKAGSWEVKPICLFFFFTRSAKPLTDPRVFEK